MEKFSFRLYREYGALNSPPIFDAVESGLKKLGHEVDPTNGQIPVIWSVLWSGRMEKNRQIYDKAKSQNLPVMIIEVGNLRRNFTWRVSLDNVNGRGIFGNYLDLDQNRHSKLNISLKPYQVNRKSEILITTQHERGLQWKGMPDLTSWISSTVREIQKYTDRKILIRPHPRWKHNLKLDSSLKNVHLQQPRKLPGSYDDFDIDYSYHCVINHNSGPTIQAGVAGIPVICHDSSLAFPISNILSDIENLKFIDRESWFSSLCHTEWFVDEISQGVPFYRLQSEIEKFFI